MEDTAKYQKTERILAQAMKVAQRELPDGQLKVDMLQGLLKLKEKLDHDGDKKLNIKG